MRILLTTLALAVLTARAATTMVVDDSGTAVRLPHPPRRIVSITPGTTEMLFAIGVGDRVVGDTTSCDYPPAARKIAKIGDWTPNYEKIVGVKPDLVVVDNIAVPTAAARLRQLREPVFVIHPDNIKAVESDIEKLGAVTGSDIGARRILADMRGKVHDAEAIAAHGQSPRVLAVVGHDPLFVAGAGTFIDDAIKEAGGVNVADGVHGYTAYSMEQALAHPPDVLLAGTDDAQAIRSTAAFRTLPAVRNHRVVILDPDLMERPGPRLADGILLLARALHEGAPSR